MNTFDVTADRNSKRATLYVYDNAEATEVTGVITGIPIEELFDMVNILLGGVQVGPPEGLRFEYERDYEVRTSHYRMFWQVQRNAGEVFVYENTYGGDLLYTYLFSAGEFMHLSQQVIEIAALHCVVAPRHDSGEGAA